MAYSRYELRGSRFLSAEKFFAAPPVDICERLAGRRDLPDRKTEHLDYMDFAEVYADYVVTYEKANWK